MDSRQRPLQSLYSTFKTGEISRRAFVQRASALGMSAASIAFLANTGAVHAQGGTPVIKEGGTISEVELVSYQPAVGTEDQERGGGGELNIIQWQAATMLSPHTATGDKDFLSSVLVLEPLMHYAPDSTMIPNLVTEVPSKENGGLSDDLTEVTLKLMPDVVWSDGEPFTADDVVSTIEWILDPANNSVSITTFQPIETAEAVDNLTVKISFREPNPVWFTPFTGTTTGFVYPKHVLDAGKEAYDAFLSSPIGTGPYVVDSFTPNDQITFSVNENYREPNKPFFATVNIKGGGDAPAAARAVIQTGEYDFAWNLQVEPDILTNMVSDDAPGKLTPFPGVGPERININFSDPNKEVDGQRSEMNTPHPFLTDNAVREAIATGIDRQTIADEFYGFGQPVAANIVYGDPDIESGNTSWEFDLDKAANILEETGWTLNDDGIREKDGVEIKIVFATSVNSVRQKTQAVIKSNLEEIGIGVEIQEIDAGILFDGSVGNDQNRNHFYRDLSMYLLTPTSPRPLDFMDQWYAGPDGSNIAQKSNDWNGQNQCRWQNEEYDKLYEQAQSETDPDALADLFIQMNDMLINEHVVVPLVVRGAPRGVSRRLREENLALAPFGRDYWNIANWNLADDAG